MNSTPFRTSALHRTAWCGGADHHINKENGSVGAVWSRHKKTAPKSGLCGVANMSPHPVWLNLLRQIYTQVRNLSTHVVGGPPNRAGTRARALCYLGGRSPHLGPSLALRPRSGDRHRASTFNEEKGKKHIAW